MKKLLLGIGVLLVVTGCCGKFGNCGCGCDDCGCGSCKIDMVKKAKNV